MEPKVKKESLDHKAPLENLENREMTANRVLLVTEEKGVQLDLR